MTFDNDWAVTDNPADHSKFKDQPSFVRKLRTDLQDRLADILYGFTSGDTTPGLKQVLLNNAAADPSAPTDAAVLFAKKMYTFTVSGISVMPTAGATYTNNTKTFTVFYASATKIYASGTGEPAASGDLTKASGTGDATIAFSAMTSKSEVYARHESAGVVLLTALGKIIGGALTGLASIASAAGIIPIANLASGTPDGTMFVRDDNTLAVPQALDGEIVQVVPYETGAYAAGTTAIPNDDTIPQNTEGDLYMTHPGITPKSATNILRIDVVLVGNFSGIVNAAAALFHSIAGEDQAGALACALQYCNTGVAPVTIAFTHYMVAGEVVEKVFKVRAGGSTGSFKFNGGHDVAARLYGGVLASSIIVSEIKAS